SRNSCASIRFTRNALRPFPDARRGGAQCCAAQFPKLLFAKSGCAWHSDLVVSGDLFHHRQLDPGYDRGAELALSAVAGNPYPHPDAAFAEGKTASAKEPAVLRHFSEPE